MQSGEARARRVDNLERFLNEVGPSHPQITPISKSMNEQVISDLRNLRDTLSHPPKSLQHQS